MTNITNYKLSTKLLWGYWSVIDPEAEIIFSKTVTDLQLTPDQAASFRVFLLAIACFDYEASWGLDDDQNELNQKNVEKEWREVCKLYLIALLQR